jgi:hypothetical protein
MLAEMREEDAVRAERRVDRIFPVPFTVDVIVEALTNAGFTSEISDQIVNFSNDDAARFILVPRLAEIAAPLIEGEKRSSAIREAVGYVLSQMREAGTASDSGYRSHWLYGLHAIPRLK